MGQFGQVVGNLERSAIPGRLDVDDLCTQITNQPTGNRSGPDPSQVEYPQP